MLVLIWFAIFIAGAVIGSFLNVVLARFRSGESFLQGRSRCPQCGHILRWYDLIPLVSFIILRGKCRYCGKVISWQYPLVELSTGLAFLLIYLRVAGLAPGAPLLGARPSTWGIMFFWWLFASVFILIFVWDAKYLTIPDSFSGILLIGAIGYRTAGFGFDAKGFLGEMLSSLTPRTVQSSFILNILVAAVFGFLFLFLIFFLTKGKGLGFGDVKLAGILGLILGWPGILVNIYIAFVIGGAVGGILVWLRKKTLKSAVAFGPLLVFGAFLTFLIF